MITEYQTYGALNAKAHALYGKRLRAGDLRAVARLRDMGEVIDALHAYPGWHDAVTALPPGADSAALQRALRARLRAEYAALLHYLPREDGALAAFPVMLDELDCLLSALRQLRAGRTVDADALPFLPPGSRINRTVLHGCAEPRRLAAAGARTIYHKALLQFSRALTPPDMLTAEAALQSAYFGALFRLIDKRYAGPVRLSLRRTFGQQVDWLNLLRLLRLKRFDPKNPRFLSLVIPYHDTLRPDVFRALADAPDLEACFALLQDTAYADWFAAGRLDEAEDACRRAFYAQHRTRLQTGPPSVCTLVSSYYLMELELKALLTAVETARYGAPYDDSFAKLLGEKV